LQAAHLATMVPSAKAAQPWQVGWLVIPNKTTFYLDREPVRSTFASLQEQQLGPDLLQALSTRGRGQRDVFFPNDSHLSTTGSLLLGDAVLQWLRNAPPAPPR
jgi:hypothetical protein